MEKPKQMLEIGCKVKTINNGLGNYTDRVYRDEHGKLSFWDERKYTHYNEQPNKNALHDYSRRHLNFEINIETGKAQPMTIKKKSIKQRWYDVIKKHYTAKQSYVNPKTGDVYEKDKPIRNSEIKYFEVLFGGDRKRMHELAFDGKVVIGKEGIGKNGHVKRKRDIELWAEDCFRWACKHFGKENIITFAVHLEETNPHIHCDVVPLIDGKLSFTHMMRGERIEGENKCNSKERSSEYFKTLHDDFAINVGWDWGLSRGEDTKVTGATHKSMKEHQEEVRKNDQAILATETKLANLEKKLADGKVEEKEYLRKKAHWEATLSRLRGEYVKELTARVKANLYANGTCIRGEINGNPDSGRLTSKDIDLLKKGMDIRELFFLKFGKEYQKHGYNLKL